MLFKKNRENRILRGLNIALFSIRIPQEKKEEANVKGEINATEQLFAALAALKQPFLFEAAVHHIGEEIHFYLGVPRDESEAAVKQIHGIWPNAEILGAEDYNPFNAEGVSLAAYIAQKDHYALPIRTYLEMEIDTFAPMVSGLSKLDEVGEGGAIQVIMRPADTEARKSISRLLEALKRGEPLETVLKSDLVKSFGEISKSFKNKKEEAERKERLVVNDAGVKALETKLSKPLFKVNVRLIASAKTQMQAEHVLSGMAAGFSQFAAPVRNSFSVIAPRRPAHLVYAYSFREYDASTAMVLSSEEVASFFHLPIASTDIPRIKWLKSKEAPPPANLPEEGLLLGESTFRGQHKPVFLLEEDRRRHVYIVGQTGTGKSTLIYNMVVGDIWKGHGVAVLDPNGDLIQNLMASIPEERLADVIIFDPGDIDRPVGLNMLEYDRSRPEQKTFIVNEMQGIFNRLFPPESMGPMFEQYMRNALLLLMEDADNEPSTLMEVPRIFTDVAYRERRVARITNPAVADFWLKEAVKAGGDASLANMAPYITSKFNNFIANDYVRPIISQTKSAFNFREIMDTGKILLVNLSKGRIGDINANLLGMIIVGRIQMSAFGRADVADPEARRDFYLYIDEFQNFTTDSIATIFSEARKYRLNLTVAHQFIAQLTEKIRDSVFGNVGSLVSLRVGATDAETLVKQFAPTFDANDIVNIDNLNAYVKLLIRGETSKAFNMKITPNYMNNPELVVRVREANRLKYGEDRQVIEADVFKRLRE